MDTMPSPHAPPFKPLYLMEPLKAGDRAPHFSAPTQDGTIVNLSDFKGKKVILYFYPKDNTPVCTKQACNLRDGYQDLLAQGYAVVGVSQDSVQSHKKFADSYRLPFPLLADTDGTIAQAYGTARTLWFPRRTTFVIDEQGYVKHVITSVKVTAHIDQILRKENS